MISRLVLVGIVGAFGVSLPAEPEQSEWFAAARAWAVAHLAHWDVHVSGGPARPVHIASGPTRPAAPASPPVSADRPKTHALEPIEPDTASVENDLAYRLIRVTEAVPSRPVATVVKIATISETAAFEPIDPDTASVENDLAYRLIRVTEAVPSGPATSTPVKADGETVAFGPIEPGISSMENEIVDRIIRDADIQIDAVTDAADELAAAFNRWADDIEAQPSTAAAPAPGFEPIEVPEGPAWGVAGQLNQMADGLAMAADTGTDAPESSSLPDGPVAHASGAGIGSALRLTRDAACAWMTVLTGPAVVHLPSR